MKIYDSLLDERDERFRFTERAGCFQVSVADFGLDSGNEKIGGAILAFCAASKCELSIIQVAMNSLISPDLENQVGAGGE